MNLDTLGLTPGSTYAFDFFFAERHTVDSNFRLTTSIGLAPDRQYTYQVVAVDADNEPLLYTLETAPQGMQINSATGLITWNPGISQVGPHDVVVKVTDPRGAFDTQSFILTVVDPSNTAPVVNAGPDQTITLPATANLQGIVTDDGRPPGATPVVSWSVVSGPGTVVFNDPNSATTTASFSKGGTYVLRLTANDSALLSSDDVVVTVIQPNAAPIVSAGDDQTMSNGVVDYVYDNVGNRLSRTSTMPAVPSATYAYDANDRLANETYDADGNLKLSGGGSYNYTFEDRLSEVNGGAVSFTYDGDGNRVAKTGGGVTTKYLVDSVNPTGYAQVVEEIVNGAVQREYVFGHDLISQRQLSGGNWTTSYFGYDGNGSVRFLTDASGAITDTYNYDAFGALISSTGSTPNDYLFMGEQFDTNLGFYYLRARYLNPFNGRFVTRDTYEGSVFDPLTLHKYLYVANDPVNKIDPSGMMSVLDLEEAQEVNGEVETEQAAEARQAREVGKSLRFLLAGVGVVAAVTVYELKQQPRRSVRLNHYTDTLSLSKIEASGEIRNPSGKPNFYSSHVVLDAATAEDEFAVCKILEVRIAIDVYIEQDGFLANWPETEVEAKTCESWATGGWAGKRANGGNMETSTSLGVPYNATRKPVVTPLVPR